MNDGPSERWIQESLLANPVNLIKAINARLDKPLQPDCKVFSEFATQLGRADIVFAQPNLVVVVELKKDVADESAVAQVLRYIGSLGFDVPRSDVYGVVAAPLLSDGCIAAAQAAGIIPIRLSLTIEAHSDTIIDFVGTNDTRIFKAIYPEIFDGEPIALPVTVAADVS